jgi:hypothetical protein
MGFGFVRECERAGATLLAKVGERFMSTLATTLTIISSMNAPGLAPANFSPAFGRFYSSIRPRRRAAKLAGGHQIVTTIGATATARHHITIRHTRARRNPHGENIGVIKHVGHIELNAHAAGQPLKQIGKSVV